MAPSAISLTAQTWSPNAMAVRILAVSRKEIFCRYFIGLQAGTYTQARKK